MNWYPLYRYGAFSIALFMVVAIAIPFILLNSVAYDTRFNGEELLQFIGQHRTWWIWLQNLTMGGCVFAIVPFLAIYQALKPVNQSLLLIGVVVAIVCQILFLAYLPVVNTLWYMSDRLVEAQSGEYRQALISGAEALVAQNNAYGPSDGLLAISIGLISIVVWQSTWPTWIALVGFITTLAGVVGAFFSQKLGIHYLWWWVFFLL